MLKLKNQLFQIQKRFQDSSKKQRTGENDENKEDDRSDDSFSSTKLSSPPLEFVTCQVICKRNENLYDIVKRRFQNVSVNDLISTTVKRKNTVIHLQLLKVLAGKKNESEKFYWQKKKAGSTGSGSGNYNRMFMFRVMGDCNGAVVQMIEYGNRNEDLWSKDLTIRDNGGITIGTCLAVINPHPIEDYLAGDTALLDSSFSGLVLTSPQNFNEVEIDETLAMGITKSFVLRQVKVDIISTAPVQTKCGGLFCGKQDILNVLKSGRGCGCYSMKDRVSSIVMLHSIMIYDAVHETNFSVKEFSSSKFDSLFMLSAFPHTTTKKDMDMTDKFLDFEEKLDDIVQSYNIASGFTIIGWYKRGEIHDKSNKEEGVSVDNSEIVYHIVDIIPEVTEEEARINKDDKFDPRA